MRKNGKIIAIVMAATMTTALLAGCGSSGSFVLDGDTLEVVEENATDAAALEQAESLAQDMIDRNEMFMPADFLQGRENRDVFESYDEVISLLQPGEAYAYGEVMGHDGKVLIIAPSAYDNLDGNMVSIDASFYADNNGKVTNIGNVYSDGTAYPVRLDGGIIYTAGNHRYEEDAVAPETGGIMVIKYIVQSFDEDGNSSYTGFIRESNSFEAPESEVSISNDDEFYSYFPELGEKTVVNFTVVK